MNISSSTPSAGMNPPAARNQEKNDAMSAAAAIALAGLQSVPTSSTSSADGGQQTGERSNTSGNREEQVQALEISRSFPQIVSRCMCFFYFDDPERRVRIFTTTSQSANHP